MLKVYDYNGKKVKEIPFIPVTDAFRKLLFELIEDHKINTSIYNDLNVEEKQIFDLLVAQSNVNKLHYSRFHQKEIDNLINQYNIVKGEVLIGNDNPDLLKQLKLIILRLMEFKVLSMRDINPLLQQIYLLL